MSKSGKKLVAAAKQARDHLDALIAEQKAMEHAIRTGEVKWERTSQNSTPAQFLDDE